MSNFYFKRSGKNIKVFSKLTESEVEVNFENLIVKEINVDSDKKYIVFEYDNDYIEKFQYIEEIDQTIDEYLSKEKRVYIKGIINGKQVKVKIPYIKGKFYTSSNSLVTEIFQGQELKDITLKLKNFYIIDKDRYLISGGIWELKSFSI